MPSKSSNQTYHRTFSQVTTDMNGFDVTEVQGFDINLVDSVSYGNNIPNWRRVIATGGNATTNLLGIRYRIEQMPSSIECTLTFPPPWLLTKARISGNLHLKVSAPLNTDGPSFETANNIALTSFYKHLAAVEGKFKGLTFAGELRESLNMIRHPAKALRNGIGDYLKFLKRGSRLPRRSRASFVRRTWLEYSYGWRPLISDIDSAIDSFYKSKHVRPLFDMVHGTGSSEFESRSLQSEDFNYVAHHMIYELKYRAQHVVKIRGVTSSYGNGAVNSHSYGFNPVEFIPTVWELIPYSFLVDYFTNIGNIIQSWSYRWIGTNWSSRTIWQSSSNEASGGTVYADSSPFNPTHSGNVGSTKVTRTEVSRSRDYILELPSFQIQVPGMDAKWVNILALSANLGSARKSLRL